MKAPEWVHLLTLVKVRRVGLYELAQPLRLGACMCAVCEATSVAVAVSFRRLVHVLSAKWTTRHGDHIFGVALHFFTSRVLLSDLVGEHSSSPCPGTEYHRLLPA